MYSQVTLVIGGIIAVFTAKTPVLLPRGLMGFLMYCQVALLIGSIITVFYNENACPAPPGPSGFSGVGSGCPCDR